MDVVRSLADRIIVLTNGQLAADGEPAAVIASPIVQEAYLGIAPGGGKMTTLTRAAVNPALLRWARERAGIMEAGELAGRFLSSNWEAGTAQPILNQLEAFARAMHAPVGYLFLPAPPEEPMPIPDFRTLEGRAVRRPVRTCLT